MLRITETAERWILTLRLDGRLAGPWVDQLEQCWRRSRNGERRENARVDLTGVTYINAAGKALLARMHREGVQFIAADCMTTAVVEEIAGE